MTYIKEESKVSYQSKDGKEEKVFDALGVAMCNHVPNKGEQWHVNITFLVKAQTAICDVFYF